MAWFAVCSDFCNQFLWECKFFKRCVLHSMYPGMPVSRLHLSTNKIHLHSVFPAFTIFIGSLVCELTKRTTAFICSRTNQSSFVVYLLTAISQLFVTLLRQIKWLIKKLSYQLEWSWADDPLGFLLQANNPVICYPVCEIHDHDITESFKFKAFTFRLSRDCVVYSVQTWQILLSGSLTSFITWSRFLFGFESSK